MPKPEPKDPTLILMDCNCREGACGCVIVGILNPRPIRDPSGELFFGAHVPRGRLPELIGILQKLHAGEESSSYVN